LVRLIDEYVNKNKVVAYAVWASVVGLMALAWVVIIVGDAKYAGMLAAMACATSALAATLHIRCYFTRLACLVRAPSGCDGAEVSRPLRGL